MDGLKDPVGLSAWQTRDWAHEPLVAWLNESHGRSNDPADRTWVHCDQLTLHRPGYCTFCDEFASDAQTRRVARGVPFSGEAGAPDALFRTDATIKRWGGNRPIPTTAAPPAASTVVQTATFTLPPGTIVTFPGQPQATYRIAKIEDYTPEQRAKHERGCCINTGCHPVCSHFCTSPLEPAAKTE